MGKHNNRYLPERSSIPITIHWFDTSRRYALPPFMRLAFFGNKITYVNFEMFTADYRPDIRNLSLLDDIAYADTGYCVGQAYASGLDNINLTRVSVLLTDVLRFRKK